MANEQIKVEKTVTINKPAEELYRFWRNFENLPRFIKHLKEVKVYDDAKIRWIVEGLLDRTLEWDAVIVEDKENEVIAWASVQSAEFQNSGVVQFKPAPGNRGTEVKVVRKYNPPGGVIGNVIAKLFGEDPKHNLTEDLRHFKMLMEAGEIATTEGQPRGQG
ncbi:cyclase [Nostoc linckia z18]|uniref:Cyclase n=3 Tax=Nostoc TaxID=1177 RepID=A0A9Q6EM64_NOSLI|nr:SRPBCC family protein [Nostoc linckia]MBC1238286.1 SRPBCC family protein [Nostoc sp. 2RC]PHJ61267.1 cyclase [Nostoc linckia z2]PHJ77549.1 cyclase [Nostoc linckia z4]PHJ79385.1 cyclase [Nostoc linckia z6]PHJ92968.1 cyclase [Nostoc linckia z7]PHK07568.1 cyclase [Nostoc linckia z9]PHK19201.1 cyclase [Nostoc linckia z13]PHK37238.1 cyclase [Nostoc linckia z15]PHK43574.1 cyclase [Nostoc linckia z16]